MNSMMDELCLSAYEIYKSPFYNCVLGLVILLNIIGIFLLSNVFKLLLFSQKLHFNLRVLLLNVTLGIFLRTIATTCRALHRIIRALIVSDPCNFLTTLSYCTYESGIQSIPFAAVNITIPFIFLERCAATFLSKKYEKQICLKFYLGICGLIWCYAIYDSLNLAFTLPEEMATLLVDFCSTKSGAEKLQIKDIILSSNFLAPLLSALGFAGLWYYCKWAKKDFYLKPFQSHSLTRRYQLTEVMHTTQIICCLSILFGFLFIGQLTSLGILTKTGIISTEKSFSVVKEAASCSVMPVFINIFSLTFYWYLKRPKNNNPKIDYRTMNNKVIPQIAETEAYFNLYANSWK